MCRGSVRHRHGFGHRNGPAHGGQHLAHIGVGEGHPVGQVIKDRSADTAELGRTALLTCLDAPSTWASRAVGCEVGGRLAPKLLAHLLGVALS
jgi:hypothetical protein